MQSERVSLMQNVVLGLLSSSNSIIRPLFILYRYCEYRKTCQVDEEGMIQFGVGEAVGTLVRELT